MCFPLCNLPLFSAIVGSKMKQTQKLEMSTMQYIGYEILGVVIPQSNFSKLFRKDQADAHLAESASFQRTKHNKTAGWSRWIRMEMTGDYCAALPDFIFVY